MISNTFVTMGLAVMDQDDFKDWKYETCRFSGKLISAIEFLNLGSEEKVDVAEVNKAIYYAKKYHGTQMRESGVPFYSHPLEVAYMSLRYIFKTDVIVASVLHDIIEDTTVTLDMIVADFGLRISEMVNMLTRNKADGQNLSIKQSFEYIYKMGDKEVMLIKLLDRLHNLETLHVKPLEKQLHTTCETLKNFLILAEMIEKPEISELIYRKCMNINESLAPKSQFQKLGEEFRLPAPFFQSNLRL